jgi:hypothetical protein
LLSPPLIRKSVIATGYRAEANLIQDIHHLSATQRLTVDDRRPDCRRRKIVSAQCHQDWRACNLEALQHCRRAAETAVTATVDRTYLVHVVDMEKS